MLIYVTLTALYYFNSRVLLLVYISPKLSPNQLVAHPVPIHLLTWSIYRLPQISSVVQPSLHWPIQIIWAFMFPLQQVLPRAIQRELDVPSGDIHSLILKELVSALARPIGTRCLLQET